MIGRQQPNLPVAIIYDLDGVLTDTAKAHALAWRRLCDVHNLAASDALLDTLRGRSRADSLRAILGPSNVPNATFHALLAEKNDYYLEAIASLSPNDVLPGARENVVTARHANALTAVGSASKNARLVLDRLTLTPLFDVIVDGNDVVNPKPHPDVFEHAARLLGVPPARCAVIEDAASGIAAASAANMLPVGVGPHVDAAACAVTAPSLNELDICAVIALLEQNV
ncbi:MAG: beta-phosphoglucomutase family hydrolase [Nitriliruptoraceae bacterium]